MLPVSLGGDGAVFPLVRRGLRAGGGLGQGGSIALLTNSTQVVGVPNANQVNLDLVGDATFETWVRVTTSPATIYSNLISKDALLGITAWHFKLVTGSGLVIKPSIFTETFSREKASVVPLVVNDWHHLAISRNVTTGDCRFYLDGAPLGTVAGPAGAFPTNGEPVRLGRHSHQSTQSLAGNLADTRLWSVIRTDEEILANYATSLAGTETGLEAYWRYVDADNLLVDDSPNGNDLVHIATPNATFSAAAPTW